MESTNAVPYQELGLVAYELHQWEAARSWYSKALCAAAAAENYWVCGTICHQLSASFRAEQRLDDATTWSILAFAARRMTPFDDTSDADADEIALPSSVRTDDLTRSWQAMTGEAPPPALQENVERILAEGEV